jgi:bifunctional oligoribonuclease and PAP phosphatase NrnA
VDRCPNRKCTQCGLAAARDMGIKDSAMGEDVSFKQIGAVLEGNASFLIISHLNPDGDAIGSTLAFGEMLEQMGKKVFYRNESGVPASLEFLPHSSKVEKPNAEVLDVEVVIALDCATRARLGEGVLAQAARAHTWINVDHHKTNPGYGDINYVDPSSPATGQIVFNLFKELGYPITAVARDNLYVAVSSDTGSFRYQGTTEKTYLMAGELVAMGLNVSKINEQLYDSCPVRRLHLLREILKTTTISEDGLVADYCLYQSVKDDYELLPDDSDEMISFIRAVDTVQVAVAFEDIPEGKVRVSLRSKSDRLDVSKVAQNFGGGGHARAAGLRIKGPIQQARQKVLDKVFEMISSELKNGYG